MEELCIEKEMSKGASPITKPTPRGMHRACEARLDRGQSLPFTSARLRVQSVRFLGLIGLLEGF